MAYFIVFIRTFIDVLQFAIVARVLMSWVQMNGRPPQHPLVNFLYDVTEPVLKVAKKITPRLGMLDLSPLIALFGLDILKSVLLSFLSGV